MPVALRPVVALLALTLAGCDAAPGFDDETRRPSFAEAEITPVTFDLESADATATVPLAVTGVLEAEGAVELLVVVRYAETIAYNALVDGRTVNTDTLVTEVALEVEPGPFRVDVPLTLPRGATGDYTVRVSTEGADGRAGDQLVSVFQFSAPSLGPPSVTVADAAAVDRPTGDTIRTVPIAATVTDPDGRENIALVFAQVPDGGGFIGELFDSGGDSDTLLGDGVYSAAVRVDSSFVPGTYALEVVAVDRAGTASDPAPFTFTVR
ncbi:hypothetical protein [Rubrivirga sp.]|uniref:hypothetical protein n=1 Tax=Rubrivirga sp. TaxID=1885344 RepID=UPI003C7158C1